MRPIKKFEGNTPPVLKSGEWASNGFSAYLGTGKGGYKMFQGALDLHKEQIICGFKLKDAKIRIPSGTPFSKLQELIHELPKVMTKSDYNSVILWIEFESGTYYNDMNAWFQIMNFAYEIRFIAVESSKIASANRPIIFDSSHSFEVYNSLIHFECIEFKTPYAHAVYASNGEATLSFCNFNCDTAVYAHNHSSVSVDTCFFPAVTSAVARRIGENSKMVVENCQSDGHALKVANETDMSIVVADLTLMPNAVAASNSASTLQVVNGVVV